MKLDGKLSLLAAILPLVMLGASHATASPCSSVITFPATCTGTLDSESGTSGSVVLEKFSLSSASMVTIFTTSYGGGTNPEGSTTGPGGFQPNITLFDSTGFDIANQSPSFSPIANPDPSNGWKGDGYLKDTNVPAGTYFVTLTDWQNQMSITSTGLNTGSAAYTQFSGPGGASFMDVQGNTRNGSYALNLEASPLGPPSSVPEPATLGFMLPVLAVGLLLLRKKNYRLS